MAGMPMRSLAVFVAVPLWCGVVFQVSGFWFSVSDFGSGVFSVEIS